MVESSNTFSKLNKFKNIFLNFEALVLYKVLLGIIKAILVSALAKSLTLIKNVCDISLLEM